MKPIFIPLFCWAMAFSASTKASEPGPAVCEDLLASGGYKVVLRQAHELNPAVFPSPDQPVALEDLYLRLKDQEASPPPPAELRGQLETARGRLYSVERMSDKDLLQFYRNSVRALYIRTAGLWRIQEARTLVGSVIKKDVEEVIGYLLDQYFTPWGLENETLTPDEARRHFRERQWIRLSWLPITQFLLEWKATNPQGFPGREFSKFWDEKADGYGLKFELYHPLMLALGKVGRRSICCVSVPGCVTCPHNRRWLKNR